MQTRLQQEQDGEQRKETKTRWMNQNIQIKKKLRFGRSR